MTPEERCERVRMAYAEAGYPNAHVTWCPVDESPSVTLSGPRGVPDPVFWRGMAVCGEMEVCWPCWENWTTDTCDHDPMTSPWPEVVR